MSKSARLRLPTFHLAWRAFVLVASSPGALLWSARAAGPILLVALFAMYYLAFPAMQEEAAQLAAAGDNGFTPPTPVTALVKVLGPLLTLPVQAVFGYLFMRRLIAERAAAAAGFGSFLLVLIGLNLPMSLLLAYIFLVLETSLHSDFLVFLAMLIGSIIVSIWMIRHWLLLPAIAAGHPFAAASRLGVGQRVSLLAGSIAVLLIIVVAEIVFIVWPVLTEPQFGIDPRLWASAIGAIAEGAVGIASMALWSAFLVLAHRHLEPSLRADSRGSQLAPAPFVAA